MKIRSRPCENSTWELSKDVAGGPIFSKICGHLRIFCRNILSSFGKDNKKQAKKGGGFWLKIFQASNESHGIFCLKKFCLIEDLELGFGQKIVLEPQTDSFPKGCSGLHLNFCRPPWKPKGVVTFSRSASPKKRNP